MLEGFIPGSRASLIMDLLACLMLVILGLQAASLFYVRRGRRQTHRRIQLALATALGLSLLSFEVHIRLHGWTQHAEASPYFPHLVYPALYFHLVWALSCVVLWCKVLWQALRLFPADLKDLGPHATTHRRDALLAVGALVLTTSSG